MDSIVIGGKKMRWTDGQRQVAKSGEWILHASTMSLCGKYQNYKLYRDAPAAPKKAFYLGYNLETETLAHTSDVIVLQEHYHGMAEWVVATIKGEPAILPQFKPWNDIGKEKEKKPVGKILTGPIVADMLKFINEQWYTPAPSSIFPQTRKQGRYAPALLAHKFGINELDAEATIGHLIYSQVLAHETRNRSTKIKGLKVIGSIPNG